ncbi:MAG: Wzz/FepE/Etk N-terminal domain-containing protein [Erysipelotrichaceae bacterium]|nr:Wzz/FepE/Etk N-terminal domain-containing protein [Erysipelotrichaceae bacterium]
MSDQKLPVQPKPIADDEIDLLALVKTFWNGRKTIILSVISGAILGIVVAMVSPVEYTATTVMVPQLGNDSQSKLGGLGGLAALAGISLDMSQGSELSPLIYPQIVSSIPFQLELMNAPLNFQEYTMPISLFDYYTKYSKTSVLGTVKKYTIGLPFVILKAIKGKPKELKLPGDTTQLPILLTANQVTVQKALESMVTLDLNAKEGYITLTTSMPEALAAAQLTQKAQVLLQKYITEFKIEKAKANLSFIQERYNENKAEFEKAQVSLAMINDRNKDFTTGLSRIEAERIQTRYTISFSVFQELAKQLEQAKMQVKKDTPIFTIVEPVTIPSEKSKPKKAMIVFIWIFLGGIIGTGIVFGREFMKDIRKKWKESV